MIVEDTKESLEKQLLSACEKGKTKEVLQLLSNPIVINRSSSSNKCNV